MIYILVSFLLSILCYVGKNISTIAPDQTQLAFGGSVMMYGFSLCIEVYMLLDPEKPFLKKVVVGSVFVAGIIAGLRGLAHVFDPGKVFVDTTIIICLIPVLIYIADWIFFYLIKSPTNQSGGIEAKVKDVTVGGK